MYASDNETRAKDRERERERTKSKRNQTKLTTPKFKNETLHWLNHPKWQKKINCDIQSDKKTTLSFLMLLWKSKNLFLISDFVKTFELTCACVWERARNSDLRSVFVWLNWFISLNYVVAKGKFHLILIFCFSILFLCIHRSIFDLQHWLGLFKSSFVICFFYILSWCMGRNGLSMSMLFIYFILILYLSIVLNERKITTTTTKKRTHTHTFLNGFHMCVNFHWDFQLY